MLKYIFGQFPPSSDKTITYLVFIFGSSLLHISASLITVHQSSLTWYNYRQNSIYTAQSLDILKSFIVKQKLKVTTAASLAACNQVKSLKMIMKTNTTCQIFYELTPILREVAELVTIPQLLVVTHISFCFSEI